MKNRMKRIFLTGCFIGMAFWGMGSNVYAETMQPEDETAFDTEYYAGSYSDLEQALGDGLDALLDYLADKKAEGWNVSLETETTEENVPSEVPSEPAASETEEVSAEPAKLPSISSSASGDAQKDAQARIIAQQIADSCTGETDLEKIRQAAKMVYTGYVKDGTYTSDDKDYRSAYGVFCKGVYTCAGTTRAMGMVLECMGYEWMHANPNSYTHQWCIVVMDGKLGWVDAMGGVADYGEHPWTTDNVYITPEGYIMSWG